MTLPSILEMLPRMDPRTRPNGPEEIPAAWEDMTPEQQAGFAERIFDGGFGSELKARKIFMDEGFDSWAFYFHDKDIMPAGGKGGNIREVDIQAHATREPMCNRDFEHHLVGEVKKGHTWILGDALPLEKFNAQGSIPFSHPKWLLNTCIAAPGDSEMPRGGYDAGAVNDALVGLALLPDSVSTSLSEHRERGDADWYQAAVKVFKACDAFAAPPVYLRRNYEMGSDSAHTIVPLLILDGNLLSVTRGATGDLSLEQRDHALLRFSFGSPGYPGKVMFIHVVSMKGLAPFLRLVRRVEDEVAAPARRVRLEDPGPIAYPY